MIRLRELQPKDADGMLEWMHDPELVQNFRFDATTMTREKVESFINKSQKNQQDQHFAIVTAEDEYLGTISLKNIDNKSKNGEYAIAMRKKAIGTGAAFEGTKLLLERAFNHLHLEKVYLNVLSENKRAIRFYEKLGFHKEGEFLKHLYIHGRLHDLSWFAIFKEPMRSEKV